MKDTSVHLAYKEVISKLSIANTDKLPQNSLVIPEGVQIRIPANPIDVYNDFNRINS